MKDLSFADIWDDLIHMYINDNDVLAVLTTIFFRMICMVDTEVEDKKYPYTEIDIVNGNIIGKGY